MNPQNGCRETTGRQEVTLTHHYPDQSPLLAAVHHGAVAITAIDGREHLIPQFALAERWRDDGWYPAWCGTWVAGASMCEPPGKPCDLCACVAQVTHTDPNRSDPMSPLREPGADAVTKRWIARTSR
jgi:hypothetical protein